MAKKPTFEVGGSLTYQFDIVRVGKEGVTVQFRDGTRKTLQEDDAGIIDAEPMPKPVGFKRDRGD